MSSKETEPHHVKHHQDERTEALEIWGNDVRNLFEKVLEKIHTYQGSESKIIKISNFYGVLLGQHSMLEMEEQSRLSLMEGCKKGCCKKE